MPQNKAKRKKRQQAKPQADTPPPPQLPAVINAKNFQQFPLRDQHSYLNVQLLAKNLIPITKHLGEYNLSTVAGISEFGHRIIDLRAKRVISNLDSKEFREWADLFLRIIRPSDITMFQGMSRDGFMLQGIKITNGDALRLAMEKGGEEYAVAEAEGRNPNY